jgi:hypothetical protein
VPRGLPYANSREWRRKALADQTWTHFKAFFATEYNELKEQQKLNTNQNNFHNANSAIDLTTAIDSLAMAATSDRDVMTQLTATNKQLVQTIHQLTEQLGKAQAELSQAKQQQVPKPKSTTHNKPGQSALSLFPDPACIRDAAFYLCVWDYTPGGCYLFYCRGGERESVGENYAAFFIFAKLCAFDRITDKMIIRLDSYFGLNDSPRGAILGLHYCTLYWYVWILILYVPFLLIPVPGTKMSAQIQNNETEVKRRDAFISSFKTAL